MAQVLAGHSLMYGTAGPDETDVFGRAVVVQNAAQAGVGCGVIGGAFGVRSAVVRTAAYPGLARDYPELAASLNVDVMAWLSEAGGTLTLRAVLSGLEADAVGGIHIHSGFSCDAQEAPAAVDASVGGHYQV